MSEPKEVKAKKWHTATGRGVDLVGFSAGTITTERLQSKECDNLIKAIQNFERERNCQVLGKLVVFK